MSANLLDQFQNEQELRFMQLCEEIAANQRAHLAALHELKQTIYERH